MRIRVDIRGRISEHVMLLLLLPLLLLPLLPPPPPLLPLPLLLLPLPLLLLLLLLSSVAWLRRRKPCAAMASCREQRLAAAVRPNPLKDVPSAVHLSCIPASPPPLATAATTVHVAALLTAAEAASPAAASPAAASPAAASPAAAPAGAA